MSIHGKVFGILLLCMPSLLFAGEEAESETGQVEVVQPERLRQLVRDLDADRYSKRQAATKELSAAGEAAIPVLLETARKASAEAASRCIQILEEHLQSDDDAARTAAAKSLRELADSAKESTARLARKALGEDIAELDPLEEGEDPFALPGEAGGRFQLQLQMNGFGGRRVTRRVVNGVKDTTVDDNGKKIKIHEEPNGKVKLTVTQPGDDDKPVTKTYEADSVDELQKKHADAYELFKRYSSEGPRIRIGPKELNLNPLFPGRIFPPGNLAPPKDPAPPRDEEIGRLKRTVEFLKQLNLGDLDDEERTTLRKELERALQELGPKSRE